MVEKQSVVINRTSINGILRIMRNWGYCGGRRRPPNRTLATSQDHCKVKGRPEGQTLEPLKTCLYEHIHLAGFSLHLPASNS